MAPDDGSRRRVHTTPHGPRRGGRELRVLVADGRGRRVRAGALVSWLRRIAPVAARGTVSIALVSDQRIRALNSTYRRKNGATDVLSFPAVDPHERRRRTAATDFLGDIVIARGVAERQARAAGHSQLTELRVLALHGLLHLLGYDHERDRGTMRRIEEQLRRKGGLREGLIERRSGGALLDRRAGAARS
jgi:probable rRNA maturation factor